MRKNVYKIGVRMKRGGYRNEYVLADNEEEAISKLKEKENYFVKIESSTTELVQVLV